MQFRVIRSRLILHGLLLLALSIAPFLLGLYQSPGALMFLLLLVWPIACFFSPLRLALRGAQWFIACLPAPIFLILPAFALLTPSAMRYLGIYLVFDIILVICGALFGSWRNAVRGRRTSASGLSLRG